MSVYHRLPWSGDTLDPLPRQRATDAVWFAETVYLKELDYGADPDSAREVALNRLRSRHAAEILAAEAALDMRKGLADAAA